jgi:transposase
VHGRSTRFHPNAQSLFATGNADDEDVARMRERHIIRALHTVGAHEISFCKGRKFATVVYDLDRACVLWVRAAKGRETTDLFFNESLSERQN